MQHKVYLFDYDYTLADSSKGIVTCFQNVLKQNGYHNIGDEAVKRTIGKTLEKSFSILTNIKDHEQLLILKEEYIEESHLHMTSNTILFPETKEVLQKLKAKGVRLGIIYTKYRYQIEELLAMHFPEDFFEIMIGGEDVTEHKPSPEGLIKAITTLEVDKNEVLYIGDSTVDGETALHGNVDFVGVLNGITSRSELQAFPHYAIIDDLNGLLTLNDSSSTIYKARA